MSGTVYTFNLFDEPAKLSLNGGAAGDIAGNGGKEKGFTPAYAAVATAKHDDENTGKWYRGGDGKNSVQITWDSGKAVAAEFQMPTIENSKVSIDDDLIVYIGKDKAFVQDARGFVLEVNDLEFHAAS